MPKNGRRAETKSNTDINENVRVNSLKDLMISQVRISGAWLPYLDAQAARIPWVDSFTGLIVKLPEESRSKRALA